MITKDKILRYREHFHRIVENSGRSLKELAVSGCLRVYNSMEKRTNIYKVLGNSNFYFAGPFATKSHFKRSKKKLLLNSFQFNSHMLEFLPHTHTLELHCKI